MDDGFCVYLVECADGTLYTGIARDVARRVEAHNRGRGARYTRGRGPVHLLGQTSSMSRADALRLELHIKRLRGPAKLRYLTSPNASASASP